MATGLEEETIPVPMATKGWQPSSSMLPLTARAGKPPLGSNPCSRERSSCLKEFSEQCGKLSSFIIRGNPESLLTPVHSLVTWHSSRLLVALQQVQVWQAHLMYQQHHADTGSRSNKIKTSFDGDSRTLQVLFCWYSDTMDLVGTIHRCPWSVSFSTANWLAAMLHGLGNVLWAKNA